MNIEYRLKRNIINVNDLAMMKQFYVDKIGLDIIEESSKGVLLGVNRKPILELRQTNLNMDPNINEAGLFHTAILLPDERYLGYVIEHLIRKNVEIGGAGDHLYSQALYLDDPEGNGIEIYADRPQSEWTIHEDGTIESATLAVDIDRLLEIRIQKPWSGLPTGTVLGHVHLQISDIEKARAFYVNLLKFELKSEMQQALFVSHRGYHHDLGINAWAGKGISNRRSGSRGIEAVVFGVESLQEMRLFLEQSSIKYITEKESIIVEDPFGINIKFESLL